MISISQDGVRNLTSFTTAPPFSVLHLSTFFAHLSWIPNISTPLSKPWARQPSRLQN